MQRIADYSNVFRPYEGVLCTLDVQALVHNASVELAKLAEDGFCSVTLIEEGRPFIQSYWNSNLGDVPIERGQYVLPDHSLSGTASQTRDFVRWDYAHDLPFQLHPSVYSLTNLKYLAVPILSRNDRAIGALVLGHPTQDLYSERRLESLVSLSGAFSIALQNVNTCQIRLADEVKTFQESVLQSIENIVIKKRDSLEIQLPEKPYCTAPYESSITLNGLSIVGRNHNRQPNHSVLVADCQELFRKGVCVELETDDEFFVVSEAGNEQELFQGIRKTNPDVIVLCSRLSEERDIAVLCLAVLEECPCCTVIVFADRVSLYFAQACLDAGARAVLLKEGSSIDLPTAISAALSGQVVVDQRLTRLINRPSPMTSRELDILSLMALGLSNQEIGRKLFISESTVKGHVKAILNSLGCRNRIEAVLVAQKLQLV